MLAAQLLHSKPSIVLFQDAIDPFVTETAKLHRLSSQLENRLTLKTILFRSAGHRIICPPPKESGAMEALITRLRGLGSI
jgi:hypothetical protein